MNNKTLRFLISNTCKGVLETINYYTEQITDDQYNIQLEMIPIKSVVLDIYHSDLDDLDTEQLQNIIITLQNLDSDAYAIYFKY